MPYVKLIYLIKIDIALTLIYIRGNDGLLKTSLEIIGNKNNVLT